jgi:NitT/TauT family transport system substrate-binding protein
MKQFASTNADLLSRRDFLKVAGGLGMTAAGMTLLQACGARPATATPIAEGAPLETTTIRMADSLSLCIAPQRLAEDLLKEEGFNNIHYIPIINSVLDSLASGELDLIMNFSSSLIVRMDTTESILILAGVHVGCFELFGSKGVNTILDLKGRSVGISGLGNVDHNFISSMISYVGLNPNRDINWIIQPLGELERLFTDDKLDAFLAFPPTAQELRAKKIGHVVVNSMMDKPWSQYFCCMIAGNRDFVQKNPIATKRVMRAILKATDICAKEPERVAKFLVDEGYTNNYDYALEAVQNIPYNRWREYDPEDTVRFYALELHDVGMIKSSPDEIIAKGTDWTFLNELKVELKA